MKLRFVAILVVVLSPLLSTQPRQTESSLPKVATSHERADDPKVESVKNSVDSLRDSVRTFRDESTSLKEEVDELSDEFRAAYNTLSGEWNIVFLILSSFIALGAIGIPLVQLWLNASRLRKAEAEIQKVKGEYADLVEDVHRILNRDRQHMMDSALRNLTSSSKELREEAFEYISESVYPADIQRYQLVKMKSILQQYELPDEMKIKLTYFLYKNQGNPTSDEFFLSIHLFPS